VHPSSIWENGKRVAIFNDDKNSVSTGNELPVLRDDRIIGMLYIKAVGGFNAYGNFYSHDKKIKIEKNDFVAIPLPDALPARCPNVDYARILLHTLSDDGIWILIDRGIDDGLDDEWEAAVLKNGTYVGYFELVFAGKDISYGKLFREAIFNPGHINNFIVDLKHGKMERALSSLEKAAEMRKLDKTKKENSGKPKVNGSDK